jgi:hypothetical protein
MKTVKGFWDALQRGETIPAVEAMLLNCHEDVEFRPYFADGRTFHGIDEIRAFFRERAAAGASMHASAWSFDEIDDDVVVTGSVRVRRPDGSMADAQLRWTYGFRDGRIAHAEFAPLARAVPR